MDTQTELIVGMIRDVGTKVDDGIRDVRNDVSEVHKRVDSVLNTQQAHELEDTDRFGKIDGRLARVEELRTAVVWLVGAVVLTLLGAGADVYLHHLGGK